MAEKKKTETTLPGNPEALKGRLGELREKIRKMRFDAAAGQLDDTSQIKKSRRELARVLTALGKKS
ncbi:MAG: 50S ribosomal protein L29 [Spirochaetes bacterium]|nr:50S ribosomal protein L29 [Spirochaetota bacterium]